MRSLARVAPVLVMAACGRLSFDQSADGGNPDVLRDEDIDGNPSSGLVIHYTLDAVVQAPGGNIRDASGNALHASCVEGTSCPAPVLGILGGAMSFDGIDDIVVRNGGGILETASAFTIAAWVNPGADVGDTVCIVGKLLGAVDLNSWQLCLSASNLPSFFSDPTSGASDNVTAIERLPMGEWHHVAGRWDGANKTLWVDGDLVAGSIPNEAFGLDGGQITIGADIDGGSLFGGFIGAIDDVRLYDRALTDAEIAELATP